MGNDIESRTFKNDAELWLWLLNGGVVESISPLDGKKLYLKDGFKWYTDGKAAPSCLLSFDYWVKSI